MCTREGYLEGQEASGIKVGDKVRVTRKANSHENGWCNSWVSTMDENVGNTAKVSKICGQLGITLRFREHNDDYAFPYFVLEKVTDSKEKFYDDNGVELLPGDVVAVWNYSRTKRKVRSFLHKQENIYLCSVDGELEFFRKVGWSNAEFYARPPAKQKYVRSRKEVAQILLDDGYEPMPSGSWVKGYGGEHYGPGIFTDCGKKLSDCMCLCDEKFLIER